MGTTEAVVGDSLNEMEEVDPVIGELFQVLVDHLQCTLKQGFQNIGNISCCIRL